MSTHRRRTGGSPLGRPVLASLALHAGILLLLWWGGPSLKRPEAVHVRLVRQAGGGMNRPGWVSDAPPAETPAAQPEESAAPAPEPAAPAARNSAPTMARTPNPRPTTPAQPAREPERPRRESDQATRPAAPGERTRRAGSDAGAGPRGAGSSRTGATADQPGLEGMSQYLVRLENSIQRTFKYPARSSGRKAVFHFLVDRQGRVSQLEQVGESGLPGLDLAGRSSITRAVLPPLPPVFPYDQIGVTFTFVDE
ncbi:MAG: TonB C-terminal domain-containing protein [Candidatus Delongbacteria bacterium]